MIIYIIYIYSTYIHNISNIIYIYHYIYIYSLYNYISLYIYLIIYIYIYHYIYITIYRYIIIIIVILYCIYCIIIPYYIKILPWHGGVHRQFAHAPRDGQLEVEVWGRGHLDIGLGSNYTAIYTARSLKVLNSFGKWMKMAHL